MTNEEGRARSQLLDVPLEASLQFGATSIALEELFRLGPGDVLPLDRHVDAPVDLLVGGCVVARGDVVIVRGNFALRVTEVCEPEPRLESA